LAEVIDLELHRPVWVTCKEVCRACGLEQTSSVHLEADWDRLECSGCHAMESAVTHFDAEPDNPEYVWRPRIELAKQPLDTPTALRHS
jgi:hypothetical protein